MLPPPPLRVTPLRAARVARLRGLYAIADDSFAPDAPALVALVAAFLRGGARLVQLRCKRLGSGAILEAAKAAARACHASDALLFLNDRPDLAVLAGCDGVHLGQDDLPVAEARALLGPDALITLSTHTDAELDGALEAARAGLLDGVGFGPIFATQTKRATAPGAAALPAPHGIGGLQRALDRIDGMPLIAIGGIDAPAAKRVSAAGASCVAVISALCKAPDPEAAAREFTQAIGPGAGYRLLSGSNT